MSKYVVKQRSFRVGDRVRVMKRGCELDRWGLFNTKRVYTVAGFQLGCGVVDWLTLKHSTASLGSMHPSDVETVTKGKGAQHVFKYYWYNKKEDRPYGIGAKMRGVRIHRKRYT